MQNARLALSMSLICGLALLTVMPVRGANAPAGSVDCVSYADLNLDAAAQKNLDELIKCHDTLSLALDCHEGLHSQAECASALQVGKDNWNTLRRFNVALANDERALRRQANELTEANDTRKKLVNTLSTDTRADNKVGGEAKIENDKKGREDQKGDLSEKIALAGDDIKLIKSRVAYSEKKLFVNSEDYDDYFFRLNTGYEFVAVDKLFSKGTPRVALLINSKTFGEDVNDRIVGLHFYGIRINAAAVLNSSAEVTPTLTTTDNTAKADDPPADPEKTPDVKQSLGIEFQAVVPFIRTRLFSPNNLRSYLSVIGTAAGLKTDDDSRAIMRYYSGLRLSINPELYSDFMVGRTERLKSLRFEYRGQFPVYTLESGDRIFLGGIINLGLNHREKNEGDVFRVYVSWNTDIKKLFSGKEGS
ncbi:MAG: hypothetical protein ABIS20_16090 [Thermoanaerobaculia bacterium]